MVLFIAEEGIINNPGVHIVDHPQKEEDEPTIEEQPKHQKALRRRKGILRKRKPYVYRISYTLLMLHLVILAYNLYFLFRTHMFTFFNEIKWVLDPN